VLISKAQQRAVTRYVRRNYDQLLVRLPKGQGAVVREKFSKTTSFQSLNAYLVAAVESFDEFQRHSKVTTPEPGLFLHFTEVELADISKLASVFGEDEEDVCRRFILRNVKANQSYLRG
jgi:hypothetical protein